MYEGFINAARETLASATVVIDQFHEPDYVDVRRRLKCKLLDVMAEAEDRTQPRVRDWKLSDHTHYQVNNKGLRFKEAGPQLV